MPRRKARPFPYWLLAAGFAAVALALAILSSPLHRQILDIVSQGVSITIFVTLVSYTLACLLGLVVAIAGMSRSTLLRETARLYVEIIRGLPMLVLLFYIAFAGAPALVALANWLASPLIEAGWMMPVDIRDFPLLWRAIVALMIGYAAFIAEIFRAGLQAVDRGQIEAGIALGLSPWHRLRFIVFPQALRTILPPLGNDLVAMVKDSSLVSVLGVADITQMGKVYAAGSFRYLETYSIVAYVYLLMTISLSLAARGIEQKLRRA